MKRGSKRGQFYIIAAVIIIFVIIGFLAIKNYALPRKENIKIYDLADELKLETGSVYDYGVYNKSDTNALMKNWTDAYYDYSKTYGNVENWVFIYGSRENMTALLFTTQESGSVCINFGGGTCVILEKTIPGKGNIIGEEGTIEITFDPQNFTYTFDLKQGENFFFIIKTSEYSIEG